MGLGRETIEVRGTHPIEGPWYHPDSSLMLFHLGHHSFLVTARCIPLFGNTLFYLFISWWTFDVFPLFGYGESCHYEHLCTRFCVNTHFPFFGYLPGGGITGSCSYSVLNILRNFQILCTVHSILHPPSQQCLRVQFPHILISTCYFLSFG